MSEKCRLCGGTTSVAFPMTVMRRYDVTLFRCVVCGSLQTERPFWLAEAYSSAIAIMDTGAVQRNLVCQAGISAVAHVFGVRGRCLDFGGGTGLLCRLLRDLGHDAYVYDRYAQPEYARAFRVESLDRSAPAVELLSCIEVFEHLEAPAEQLAELFALSPTVLVATTIPYGGEGPGWWYLSPDTGQHIFFYSRTALKQVAVQFGYAYFAAGPFHIFSKLRIGPIKRALLRCLLSNSGLRLGRIWIAATQRGAFAHADYQALSKSASGPA